MTSKPKNIPDNYVPDALDNAVLRKLRRAGAESRTDARNMAVMASQHGADCGISGFIATIDCIRFASAHRTLIAKALNDDASDMGVPLAEMLASFKCLKGCDVVGALLDPNHDDRGTMLQGLAWYALERCGHRIESAMESGGHYDAKPPRKGKLG